ncbi:hypothetical protein B0I08_11251 [Glaciihabitans tibetensis]|uniref:Uncharacterized protein n=1 Tax=Glaciihabitans tibetensis TaxID=1266600 RepID=A0A2T0V3A4_9MICO|nr:hypothetical protein B0I08_11251 [Glaciihabitans tibetensis]
MLKQWHEAKTINLARLLAPTTVWQSLAETTVAGHERALMLPPRERREGLNLILDFDANSLTLLMP